MTSRTRLNAVRKPRTPAAKSDDLVRLTEAPACGALQRFRWRGTHAVLQSDSHEFKFYWLAVVLE